MLACNNKWFLFVTSFHSTVIIHCSHISFSKLHVPNQSNFNVFCINNTFICPVAIYLLRSYFLCVFTPFFFSLIDSTLWPVFAIYSTASVIRFHWSDSFPYLFALFIRCHNLHALFWSIFLLAARIFSLIYPSLSMLV
jgi:hypothetical protein